VPVDYPTIANVSLGPHRKKPAAPFAIFFPKTESDFAALGRPMVFPLSRTMCVIERNWEVKALREFFAV
jgi:hypothetical protein